MLRLSPNPNPNPNPNSNPNPNPWNPFKAQTQRQILRPLRTLSHMPELHTIVETIIHSIGGLLPVFGIFGLIFFVFGILGEQLFSSHMNQMCYEYNSATQVLTVDKFRALDPTLCGGHQVCTPTPSLTLTLTLTLTLSPTSALPKKKFSTPNLIILR